MAKKATATADSAMIGQMAEAQAVGFVASILRKPGWFIALANGLRTNSFDDAYASQALRVIANVLEFSDSDTERAALADAITGKATFAEALAVLTPAPAAE